MSTYNSSSNKLGVLTPGQEGTTGNNRGLNESGIGMDRDLGTLDNGVIGGAEANGFYNAGANVNGVSRSGAEILNTGGSSASEGGMGSGNRDDEGNSNLANNSNIGNEQNAEKLGGQQDKESAQEKSNDEASGNEDAVSGNS